MRISAAATRAGATETARSGRAGWGGPGPARSLAVLIATACLLLGRPAQAQIGSDRYSSLVMRESTGEILSAINPDDLRFPASLTKMMTLYMVFEALRDRRIALDQGAPVSAHAAAMSPSKLGLMQGTRVDVQQLIMGLVTKSANDGAAVLGELLGGSEERFAQMMTLRARALGMSRTVFRNASGLPDTEQLSTARDLALLARHLIEDFPDQYRYFSLPMFVFHGRVIPNHDRMLQSYPGADGIKTGYTEASGFNLVTSAVRGEIRLIGVVLGAARPGERDQHMAGLLDAAYQQLGVPIAPRRELPGRLSLIATAAAGGPPPLLPAGLALPPPSRRASARPLPQPPRPAKAAKQSVTRGRSAPGRTLKIPPRARNEAKRTSIEAG